MWTRPFDAAVNLGGVPVLFKLTTLRTSFPPPLVARSTSGPMILKDQQILIPSDIEGVSTQSLLGREVEVEHDRFLHEGVTSPIRTRMTVVGLTDPAWQQDGTSAGYGSAATVRSWIGEASATGGRDEIAEQGYDQATVIVGEARDVAATMRDVQAMHLLATATQDLTPQLPDQIQIVKTLTQVMFFALLVLAFLAVALLVRALVLQRTREVGLLKSLGYRNGQVWLLLTLELLLVSAVGVATGVIAASIAANVGAQFIPADARPRGLGGFLLPDIGLIGQSLAWGLVVVLAGSALPVYRAVRFRPVEALRDTA